MSSIGGKFVSGTSVLKRETCLIMMMMTRILMMMILYWKWLNRLYAPGTLSVCDVIKYRRLCWCFVLTRSHARWATVYWSQILPQSGISVRELASTQKKKMGGGGGEAQAGNESSTSHPPSLRKSHHHHHLVHLSACIWKLTAINRIIPIVNNYWAKQCTFSKGKATQFPSTSDFSGGL